MGSARMSQGVCGLHGLSTTKSAMTKVKVIEPVNFMSNLIQHTFSWVATVLDANVLS